MRCLKGRMDPLMEEMVSAVVNSRQGGRLLLHVHKNTKHYGFKHEVGLNGTNLFDMDTSNIQ